jgi:hypothetical protein
VIDQVYVRILRDLVAHPAFELGGGPSVSNPQTAGTRPIGASRYGFTNGVTNTTPTTSNSALAYNRTQFLPIEHLDENYSASFVRLPTEANEKKDQKDNS